MTPASIRNNNSGAIYPGPSSRKFASTTFETLRSKDGVHKIATFPSAVHGAAAHFDLLGRSYCGMTLEKAITRWCGNFYAPTYLKVLKDRADITGDTVLTRAMLVDHDIAIPLAKAMAWQEAGQDFPLSDTDWLEAHQMAFGPEAAAPAWNPRNDVPTPKIDTRRAPLLTRIKTGVASLGIGSIGVGWMSNSLDKPLIPAAPAALKQSFVNLGTWGEAVPITDWRMLGIGATAAAAVAAWPWVKGKLS